MMTHSLKFLMKMISRGVVFLLLFIPLYYSTTQFYNRIAVLNKLLKNETLPQDQCFSSFLGNNIYQVLLAEAKRHSFDYGDAFPVSHKNMELESYYGSDIENTYLNTEFGTYLDKKVKQFADTSDELVFRLAASHAVMRAHGAVVDERIINNKFIFEGKDLNYNSNRSYADNYYLIDPIIGNYVYILNGMGARTHVNMLLNAFKGYPFYYTMGIMLHFTHHKGNLDYLYNGSFQIASRYLFLDRRPYSAYDIKNLSNDGYNSTIYRNIKAEPFWPRVNVKFETVKTSEDHARYCNKQTNKEQNEKYTFWSSLNPLGQ